MKKVKMTKTSTSKVVKKTVAPKAKRRHFLSMLGLGGLSMGGISLGSSNLIMRNAQAHHTETHFNGEATHKLVYQLNKADNDYIESILFSCGEMLRKYGDDIELVVAVFGKGLHLVGKKPQRPISKIHQQRVQSLIEYGVRFQACGNTMKSLYWTDKDIIKNAQIVPVGIDGIMQLQEQGFSYISL